MKPVIIETSAKDNHEEAIRRINDFLLRTVTKELLMQFIGIEPRFGIQFNKGQLVDIITNNVLLGGNTWEDIVDYFDIDDVRICSQCGMPMECGVYADGEYYCSDECLDKCLGIEKYLELSKDADTDEDCEYYYTEW